VFSTAGLLTSFVGASSTSARQAVQDGRYLEGGSVDLTYTCEGNDPDSIGLLTAIGYPTFPMEVTVTSAAVEPSPSPTEDFTTSFIWDFTLDPDLVTFAYGLSVTSFDISDGVNPITATAGATGTSPGNVSGNSLVLVGDATLPIGYTNGPLSGTFNRTAAVDEPIEFTPGTITATVTTSTPSILTIICQPGAGVITVNDATGVAPSTTTTTRPVVTTAAPTTTTAVLGDVLPRTGTSSNLLLVVLALGLIDIGYLALTAGQPLRRRRASAS